MDKEIINNLLKVSFPQYTLINFSTSSRYSIILYDDSIDDEDDEILSIDMYPKGNPKMFIYFSRITSADIDILINIFDMDRVGLALFEIKGFKNDSE